MKTTHTRAGKSGYVSYLLVLSTGIVLTLLTVYFYRSTMRANAAQAAVQLQADYAEKEESILRAIIAIAPNRAIRAMQNNSNSSSAISEPLRWQNIFTEALVLANARNSVSSELKASLNIPNLKVGNMGDSALGTPSLIFKSLGTSGYVSAGINRSLGAGFPPPLTTGSSSTITQDPLYAIISNDKQYGNLAQTYLNDPKLNGNGTTYYGLPVETYPRFNRLAYPKINFGYAKPGDPFVAKRNWWAFSMNVAQHDSANTLITRPPRNMVLSIYEIPSQLAISASSFMSLGQYASGEAWQNVTIDGGVFVGKAVVEGNTTLPALASRRGMTLSSDAVVGGQRFSSSPFTPGVREAYQLTQGEFFPVSLASESGKVAFIPINRGADFFDRFTHETESNTVSPTSWNNYSVGALQCAMRLDITQVAEGSKNPTNLRFSYLKNGNRVSLDVDLTKLDADSPPPGSPWLFACNEDKDGVTPYNFGTAVVNVAYGKNGTYAYQTGVTGSVIFNNSRFGDPLVGVIKAGYYRPSYPFEVKWIQNNTICCIAIYPRRFAKFLAALNADSTVVNNSLVVNVDYTTATGSVRLHKPSVPCTDLDYGVILQECADMTSFIKGFSLVTNLRTYIGDDFNTTLYKDAVPAISTPTGYTGSADTYYPPCSLFMPEKRYGVDLDPFSVKIDGQVDSLAKVDKVNVSDAEPTMIRPLDSKSMSGASFAASRITVNLRPIIHPADLPPITMMNWLVVLEERKREFVGY